MQLPPSFAPLAPQSQNQNFQSYGFNVPSHFSSAQTENRLGGNVYLWYKIFCGAIVLASLMPIGLGLIALLDLDNKTTPKDRQDLVNGSIMFIVYGLVYLIPYAVGLLMPRTKIHWVLGLVLLLVALIPIPSFTTCVFLPAAIVLLVFWFKPETKAYFERN